MKRRAFANTLHSNVLAGLIVIAAASLSSVAVAQDFRPSHVVPGTELTIRTNQTIDVNRSDARMYAGMVEEDIYGTDGRIAIPRGSPVQLMVRVTRDNDLVLRADSVVVGGRRYVVDATPSWFESPRNESVLGAIAGAISGGQIRGSVVRVPRDSIVSFELERPLNVDVGERDFDRDRGPRRNYER
jgi:hypothetical protein